MDIFIYLCVCMFLVVYRKSYMHYIRNIKTLLNRVFVIVPYGTYMLCAVRGNVSPQSCATAHSRSSLVSLIRPLLYIT